MNFVMVVGWKKEKESPAGKPARIHSLAFMVFDTAASVYKSTRYAAKECKIVALIFAFAQLSFTRAKFFLPPLSFRVALLCQELQVRQATMPILPI